MQDEVLAHRIGLVPLKIDPRLVQFKRKFLRLLSFESKDRYDYRRRSLTSIHSILNISTNRWRHSRLRPPNQMWQTSKRCTWRNRSSEVVSRRKRLHGNDEMGTSGESGDDACWQSSETGGSGYLIGQTSSWAGGTRFSDSSPSSLGCRLYELTEHCTLDTGSTLFRPERCRSGSRQILPCR